MESLYRLQTRVVGGRIDNRATRCLDRRPARVGLGEAPNFPA